MLPLNPWEHYFPTKALYSACMEPVCKKHRISRTELDILLFLANNPDYDTARDVAELRCLAKSQVSQAVEVLTGRGLLARRADGEDRRVIHLEIRRSSAPAASVCWRG